MNVCILILAAVFFGAAWIALASAMMSSEISQREGDNDEG